MCGKQDWRLGLQPDQGETWRPFQGGWALFSKGGDPQTFFEPKSEQTSFWGTLLCSSGEDGLESEKPGDQWEGYDVHCPWLRLLFSIFQFPAIFREDYYVKTVLFPPTPKSSQLQIHTIYLDNIHNTSSVQLLSHVWLFVTPWTTACQASLFITNSQSLLKLMSIESVMPSNHLDLCCPLLFSPSIVPSIRVFSNKSILPIRWPEYWSFSFIISPSNDY